MDTCLITVPEAVVLARQVLLDAEAERVALAEREAATLGALDGVAHRRSGCQRRFVSSEATVATTR